MPLETDYLKVIIQAKIEYPFRRTECQFGFTEACYRRLMKTNSKQAILFVLADVLRVDQMPLDRRGELEGGTLSFVY